MTNWLSDHREVEDKTGLQGYFDFEVKWQPDTIRPDDLPGAVDPDGVSLVTALQEQLGLRLVPATRKVDVVVIDHAEHPTAN